MQRHGRRRGFGRAGTLALALTLAGCAHREPLRAAEAAFERGEMDLAARRYAEAIAANPRLLRRSGLVDRKRTADARVLADRARTLAGQQRLDEALAAAEGALHLDPDAEDLAGVRSHVLRLLGDRQVERALAAAREGDAHAARAALTLAADRGAEEERARELIASLEPRRVDPEVPGAEDLLRAAEAARERRWDAAAELYRAARDANDELLAAHVGLFEAEQALKKASDARARADGFLASGRASDARAEAEAARDAWPFDADAERLIADADAVIARASGRVDAARGIASERRWDDALAELEAARAIDASLPELHRAEGEIRRAAAAERVAAGDAHLAANDPAAALAEYRAALAYDGRTEAALRGVSEVHARRAAAERDAGNPIDAALLYELAVRAKPSDAIRAAHAETWRTVEAMAPTSFSVTDAAASGAPGGRLAAAVRSAAVARSAPPLGYVEGAADLRVDVAILQNRADERLVRSTDRTHWYQTTERTENPEHLRLLREIAEAEDEKEDLYRRFRLRWGDGRRRHGEPDEERERAYNHLVARTRSLDNEIDRLRRRLESTPRLVDRPVSRSLAYQVETWSKSAVLEAEVLVFRRATGALLAQRRDRGEENATDARTVGAAPSLGLTEDPLQLPSDSALFETLARQVGERLGAAVPDLILGARIAELRREAASLQAADDPEAAKRSLVIALALERRLDPQAAGAAAAALAARLGLE